MWVSNKPAQLQAHLGRTLGRVAQAVQQRADSCHPVAADVRDLLGVGHSWPTHQDVAIICADEGVVQAAPGELEQLLRVVLQLAGRCLQQIEQGLLNDCMTELAYYEYMVAR